MLLKGEAEGEGIPVSAHEAVAVAFPGIGKLNVIHLSVVYPDVDCSWFSVFKKVFKKKI